MFDNLKVEDVPDKYLEIIEVIGFESFCGLVSCYGGMVFYVPTFNSINKAYRNRVIRESFKGSYDEVARKYGISRSQVYNIVNGRSR